MLGPTEREALLRLDLPFLGWEIRTFPLGAVLCNGKTAGTHVQQRLRVSVEENGIMARVQWWIGHARLDGRRVGFGGWNIPLARATGLNKEGEAALGQLLAARLTV
jgi:hypothetical protein